MTQPRAVILMGLPCAGKTAYAFSDRFSGFDYISPEAMNATVVGTIGHNIMRNELRRLIYYGQSFVVDDCNHTRAARSVYVNLVKERFANERESIPETERFLIECHYLRASSKDCWGNAKQRQRRGGERINKRKFIECRRGLEEPQRSEGFDFVVDIPFFRAVTTRFTNKAVFFGFDGVVRYSKGYHSYPKSLKEVRVFDGVGSVLRRYYKEGYKLIGLCRQSAVGTKDLGEYVARACMLETVRKLKVPVDDILLCPHMLSQSCMCYPSLIGNAVIHHGIDLSHSILVGVSSVEMEIAAQLGLGRYMHRTDFFQAPRSQSEAKKVCGAL